MPVYLYKCKKCGKEFEYQQRITEDALRTCPEEVCEQECKGEGEVFRKISKNVGLVFNGSGFYLTDYVHKNGKSATSTANGNGSHNGNGTHNDNGTKGAAKESKPAESTKSDSNTAKKEK